MKTTRCGGVEVWRCPRGPELNKVKSWIWQLASEVLPTWFESWRVLIIAPSLPPCPPLVLLHSASLQHFQSSSTSPGLPCSPNWPLGPVYQRYTFISTTHSSFWLLVHSPSYLPLFIAFLHLQLPSMTPDLACLPIWPPGLADPCLTAQTSSHYSNSFYLNHFFLKGMYFALTFNS